MPRYLYDSVSLNMPLCFYTSGTYPESSSREFPTLLYFRLRRPKHFLRRFVPLCVCIYVRV